VGFQFLSTKTNKSFGFINMVPGKSVAIAIKAGGGWGGKIMGKI
jgi:hypothetical protein